MYENIRNKTCKYIKELSDKDLILFFFYLSTVDRKKADAILDFEKVKEIMDKTEKDLEKGKEDVK